MYIFFFFFLQKGCYAFAVRLFDTVARDAKKAGLGDKRWRVSSPPVPSLVSSSGLMLPACLFSSLPHHVSFFILMCISRPLVSFIHGDPPFSTSRSTVACSVL